VEEYFQVSAFEKICDIATWNSYESRVTNSTHTVLDLLDKHQVKATFFIVGWVAEKHPDIPKAIHQRGHAIGCHSYAHRKVYDLSPEEFEKDTSKAKNILEELIGVPVSGYRAPSYSITQESLWAIPILERLGFAYDSSIFPIYHDLYGIPDSPRFPYSLADSTLKEYPISTVKIFTQKIPISGGGYFRLFPYWFTKMALRKINNTEQQPFMFYLHPWELDPQQPRFQHASRLSRFRHYNNLNKTLKRFEQLLKDFSFGPIEKPAQKGHRPEQG
jgi:polysaccharide deacetylase family protein (PEP-CTERM system associated)